MAINAEAVLKWPFEPMTEKYDASRTILYALGVGAGANGNEAELCYVYEQNLKSLPTMAVVLAVEPMWMDDPRTGIDFAKVLHGEQKLEIHRPLAASATLVCQTSVEGLFDKGPKGAVLLLKRELRDASQGDLIATVRASAFLRAGGGFGGCTEGQPAPHPVPNRDPDSIVRLETRVDQALVYRLSGDRNPLHIDPEAARQAGFDRPILHGLCSYGMVARQLVETLCQGDPDRLTRFDVRFSTPVYPGETLMTEIWRGEVGTAAFRTSVPERGVVALNNGRIDYRA